MAEAIIPVGAATPVMDVVAPPKTDKQEEPAGEIDPVDALAAADQRSQQYAAADHKADEKTAKHAEHATKPKQAASSGVGLAIAATVIIVFGLAILAVYAYIQTNK
jgi:hypothetical protein